jgi:stage V sporulation protein R
VIEVAHSHNDVSYIREFLTPRVCARSRLRASAEPETERVSREEFEEVRDTLVHHHTTLGVPVVEIVDGDGRGHGELWLEHRDEGGPGLDDEYARGTLRMLAGLWGKPAVVRTTARADRGSRLVWYVAASAEAEVERFLDSPPG